eukprot:CAMPEP_0184859656 /NCGR_PEP_ID=MMETSP0580-20130426/4644_1 /TAXON_ID=1118495 /ORGANISM="Dactyliosolen fragilissimus" /LENGTH=435 /DNA_ID=CAMNT_0027356419 /DNA_START=139 /DNA_END=1446 /DNA_ORIENTATION=-
MMLPSAYTNNNIKQQQQKQQQQQQRTIVFQSIEPPITLDNDPTYTEKTYTIALLEHHPTSKQQKDSSSSSSLFNYPPWAKAFTSYFPQKGIKCVHIDILSDPSLSFLEPRSSSYSSSTTTSHTKTRPPPLLTKLLQILSNDLQKECHPLSKTVLVARGPIACLVAQYHLESLPLGGLILVDPLLLPFDHDDDDHHNDDNQCSQITMLQWSARQLLLQFSSSTSCDDDDDDDDDTSSTIQINNNQQQQHQQNSVQHSLSRMERHILQELSSSCGDSIPSLKLESGTIPMHILCTTTTTTTNKTRSISHYSTSVRHQESEVNENENENEDKGGGGGTRKSDKSTSKNNKNINDNHRHHHHHHHDSNLNSFGSITSFSNHAIQCAQLVSDFHSDLDNRVLVEKLHYNDNDDHHNDTSREQPNRWILEKILSFCDNRIF